MSSSYTKSGNDGRIQQPNHLLLSINPNINLLNQAKLKSNTEMISTLQIPSSRYQLSDANGTPITTFRSSSSSLTTLAPPPQIMSHCQSITPTPPPPITPTNASQSQSQSQSQYQQQLQTYMLQQQQSNIHNNRFNIVNNNGLTIQLNKNNMNNNKRRRYKQQNNNNENDNNIHNHTANKNKNNNNRMNKAMFNLLPPSMPSIPGIPSVPNISNISANSTPLSNASGGMAAQFHLNNLFDNTGAATTSMINMQQSKMNQMQMNQMMQHLVLNQTPRNISKSNNNLNQRNHNGNGNRNNSNKKSHSQRHFHQQRVYRKKTKQTQSGINTTNGLNVNNGMSVVDENDTDPNLVQCQFCCEYVTSSALPHHSDACGGYPKPCTVCGENIKQQNLVKHRQEMHPNEPHIADPNPSKPPPNNNNNSNNNNDSDSDDTNDQPINNNKPQIITSPNQMRNRNKNNNNNQRRNNYNNNNNMNHHNRYRNNNNNNMKARNRINNSNNNRKVYNNRNKRYNNNNNRMNNRHHNNNNKNNNQYNRNRKVNRQNQVFNNNNGQNNINQNQEELKVDANDQQQQPQQPQQQQQHRYATNNTQNSESSESTVWCPYYQYGCRAYFPKSQIQNHLRAYYREHLIIQTAEMYKLVNLLITTISSFPTFDGLMSQPPIDTNNHTVTNSLHYLSQYNAHLASLMNQQQNTQQQQCDDQTPNNNLLVAHPPSTLPSVPINSPNSNHSKNNNINENDANATVADDDMDDIKTNIVTNEMEKFASNLRLPRPQLPSTPLMNDVGRNTPDPPCPIDKYPWIINVCGRSGFNSQINGDYHLLPKLHRNRACYKKLDSSWCIRWNSTKSEWLIDCDGLKDDDIACARVQEDCLHPALVTNTWKVYNNPRNIADSNVVIQIVAATRINAISYCKQKNIEWPKDLIDCPTNNRYHPIRQTSHSRCRDGLEGEDEDEIKQLQSVEVNTCSASASASSYDLHANNMNDMNNMNDEELQQQRQRHQDQYLECMPTQQNGYVSNVAHTQKNNNHRNACTGTVLSTVSILNNNKYAVVNSNDINGSVGATTLDEMHANKNKNIRSKPPLKNNNFIDPQLFTQKKNNENELNNNNNKTTFANVVCATQQRMKSKQNCTNINSKKHINDNSNASSKAARRKKRRKNKKFQQNHLK